MLPFLKLLSRGYHKRLPPYRPATACDLVSLRDLPAPVDVSLEPEPSWYGYRVQAIKFRSSVACSCTENETVYGRLIFAHESAPWTVIVPGYGTGAVPFSGYSFFQDAHARSLLERNVNTALIELPYHLQRTPAGRVSGEGFFSPDLFETQTAVRQGVADTICLVRWLGKAFQRPVALWGTSLGGCIAGLAATLLPELAALVLMEPLDNPGDTIAVLPGAWEIRQALTAHGVPPEKVPELLRDVAPSSYQPAIPRDRILFVIPLWDRVVPTIYQERFWEAWGQPQRITVKATHTTTAAHRPIVSRVAVFLARQLRHRTH